MANYYGATRTNYFHVKDANAFRSLMSNVYADEDEIDVWEEKDGNGDTVFGFGCYGSILGIRPDGTTDNEDFDYDYEGFTKGLSKCVADDDAIIILEAGHEKLRYLVGGAMVITSKASMYYDIADIAQLRASEALNNPHWKTKICY